MPFDFITPEQFIEGAAHTGWQLYEPKPLLAEAKVGDLCECRDGMWRQIRSLGDSWGTDACLNPNLFCVFLDNGSTRNIYGAYLGTMANDLPSDIISTEPLAEVGTAEWALQMMKLGKTISRTDNRKETYVYRDGKIVANEWHRADQQWFLKYAEPTGWQLYEPGKGARDA